MVLTYLTPTVHLFPQSDMIWGMKVTLMLLNDAEKLGIVDAAMMVDKQVDEMISVL